MDMWRDLKARELGAVLPGRFRTNFRARRVHTLELSTRKEIVSAHDGGINSLQVNFGPSLDSCQPPPALLECAIVSVTSISQIMELL